ncbi:speckle-type POZ protein B-like isoform X1 [Microplitis mediator]|uniref:speckle-type POZ protein B-like isoform X1 n=1 Tax=Microplitis mediator TaxID=375433 RepID=UPI002555271C|nr:speckle-type POZ protein B-like isoform X1 [Microplitis mediator]
MASVTYDWDISNVVLQPNAWIYSPTKFTLTSKKVMFDLGLQMDINSKSLHVVVRKIDSRLAKATVEIELVKLVRRVLYGYGGGYESDESRNEFLSNEYPYFIFVPQSCDIQRKVTSGWIEFCRFDAFTNLRCKNSRYATIKDECRIKYTTIRCKITGFSFNSEEPTEINLLHCPKSCVQQNFHQFLKADLFSDVVLVVDDQALPAHKIVLSTHSPFFHKMLTTDMKESKDNRIDIKNFSADVITEMLEYFYTNKTKASNNFTIALKLIEVAEMYQIIRLKEICEATLSKNINMDNVLSILCVADDYNVTNLREQVIDFMLKNRKSVVVLPNFKDLFQSKPLLMHEFTCAMGKKF